MLRSRGEEHWRVWPLLLPDYKKARDRFHRDLGVNQPISWQHGIGLSPQKSYNRLELTRCPYERSTYLAYSSNLKQSFCNIEAECNNRCAEWENKKKTDWNIRTFVTVLLPIRPNQCAYLIEDCIRTKPGSMGHISQRSLKTFPGKAKKISQNTTGPNEVWRSRVRGMREDGCIVIRTSAVKGSASVIGGRLQGGFFIDCLQGHGEGLRKRRYCNATEWALWGATSENLYMMSVTWYTPEEIGGGAVVDVGDPRAP